VFQLKNQPKIKKKYDRVEKNDVLKKRSGSEGSDINSNLFAELRRENIQASKIGQF
jgi:hypothetical protein